MKVSFGGEKNYIKTYFIYESKITSNQYILYIETLDQKAFI